MMNYMKAIVSLVISALLGGFGAARVVQSFQPVKPLAFGSFRFENANSFNAITSPQAVVSRHAYCNGRKVLCAWLGWCASAAVATTRCDSVRISVVRSATALLDSSLPENETTPPILLDSVWFQLYLDNVLNGGPAKVKLGLNADIYDLANAAKEARKATLEGIDAANLMVYNWDDEQFERPLRSNKKIDSALGCGESLDRPIRIAALTPNQGTPILNFGMHSIFVVASMNNVSSLVH
jgi:hypothetical protein